MTAQTKELIFEITQAVLAILIVLGGGFAIISGNPHVDQIAPLIALVIGFYFGRLVTTSANAVSENNQKGG